MDPSFKSLDFRSQGSRKGPWEQGKRRSRKENSRTQVYEVCNVKNGETPAERGRIMPREQEEGEIRIAEVLGKDIGKYFYDLTQYTH